MLERLCQRWPWLCRVFPILDEHAKIKAQSKEARSHGDRVIESLRSRLLEVKINVRRRGVPIDDHDLGNHH